MNKKLLIVDDERAIRNSLKDILSYEGYDVDVAEDGEAGLAKIQSSTYDCVICDIKMPKKDGIQFLEEAKSLFPELHFIMISGHGDIETAVDAVKKGAYDFISKPPDLNRLLITVRNALDSRALIQETKQLKKKIDLAKSCEIVGQSDTIKGVLDMVDKVASTDARVLITGENGVGKELVARRIHQLSSRAQAGMVEVNCAAIPSELIESELFGHEKGSFTSAIKQRVGKFEQADRSTLFLDEIGDMSLDAQAKVLRALQEGKITRVGGDKDISVNVRVIAATNKNLLEEVQNKQFRLDLFHRLSVVQIHVPPLRERLDDIPVLLDHFLEKISVEYNQPLKSIQKDAVALLQKHKWSGNIRELRNAAERLIIFSEKTITKADVQKYILNN